MSDPDPINTWRKKLTYFQNEHAKTADPARKFQLELEIAEAEQSLDNLIRAQNRGIVQEGGVSKRRSPRALIALLGVTFFLLISLFLYVSLLQHSEFANCSNAKRRLTQLGTELGQLGSEESRRLYLATEDIAEILKITSLCEAERMRRTNCGNKEELYRQALTTARKRGDLGTECVGE